MNDLLLWSRDRRFGLSVKGSLLSEGLKECALSGFQETGGILVGYYTPEHDCAIVTTLSGPPEDSIRKSFFFKRGTQGIQRYILRLWREKKHFYLGEWHYHPKGVSVPSHLDIEQMRTLSKDKKLNCPEPILLIFGGNPIDVWTANAFVFPVNKNICNYSMIPISL